MFSRRLAQRASSLAPTTSISATAARPFSSTIVSLDKHDKYAKSPALADVTPDNAHIFDQRTQEFRAEVAERIRREREEKRVSLRLLLKRLPRLSNPLPPQTLLLLPVLLVA